MNALKGLGAFVFSFAAFYVVQLLFVAAIVWLVKRDVSWWVIVLAFALGVTLILKVFSDWRPK